jgi:hypothetical protein
MKIILRVEKYGGVTSMSDSHNCIDCGRNTAPGIQNKAEMEAMFAAGHRAIQVEVRNHEQFMVHDAVWQAAGMEEWSGCLCVGCIERRLGRALTPDDFTEHVFNTARDCTKRLRERRGH